MNSKNLFGKCLTQRGLLFSIDQSQIRERSCHRALFQMILFALGEGWLGFNNSVVDCKNILHFIMRTCLRNVRFTGWQFIMDHEISFRNFSDLLRINSTSAARKGHSLDGRCASFLVYPKKCLSAPTYMKKI